MQIRRVNFYGGPGLGKTTTASHIFARLKNTIIHNNLPTQIELVQEYVKNWAWEGRKPKGFDQVYICAQQMRKEEIPLRNGVDVVVTDSPLLMQCAYARKYGNSYWEALTECVRHFEQAYPSIHILLDRGDRPYVAKGRYESHEQAKDMDAYIKDGITLNPSDKDSVMQCVRNWIVELGELDATFRKSDIASLKSFINIIS